MANDTISIDDLKSTNNNQKSNAEENTANIPKSSGKNVSGGKLRDFGNGLKEFDPTANGYNMSPQATKAAKSDIEKALEAFDKRIEEQHEEIRKYNEILDKHNGVISEEELRKELGQENITKALDDGVGGSNEDFAGKKLDVENRTLLDSDNKPANNNEKVEEDLPAEDTKAVKEDEEEPTISELDELEKELEEDYIPEKRGKILEMPNQEIHQTEFVEAKSEKEIGREMLKAATDTSKFTIDTDIDLVGDDDREEVPSPIGVLNGVKEDQQYYAVVRDRSNEFSDLDLDTAEEDKDLAALDSPVKEDGDEDEDETPTTRATNSQKRAVIKNEIAKKMRPITKKFDLSSVTISTEPVTVTTALNRFVNADRKSFTWVLPHTKIPITMRSFTATELEKVSDIMRDSRIKDMLNVLYEHTLEPKAKSFETWCKCISSFDLDHIWFAVYGACYADSNYMPFRCKVCDQTTISDDIPMSAFVKYDSDEIKAMCDNIRKSPFDIDKVNKFEEHLVQVNDSLVFGFSEPTLYDIILVPAMLDREFMDKYNEAIGLVSYVSNIYSINYETGQLQVIDTKKYPGNETKTIKAKIIQYSKIIKSLSSDSFAMINAQLLAINDNNKMISYVLPDYKCDHCGAGIDAMNQNPINMVFTRHHLAAQGV